MSGGKLLGLDHGIKRIGVAVSDALRLSARELAIIERRSRREDFERISTIARQENTVGIVVGLPSNESPLGVHLQADTVRLWVERFSQTTDLPVLLWDEQLSSKDARELAKLKRRNPADPVDDLAARVILQSYLDALHNGLAPGI